MNLIEKDDQLLGKKIFYIEQPEGVKDILFLHGKIFKSKDWLKLNSTLETLYNLQFRFYAVDFPGFGDSEKNNIEPVDFIKAFVIHKKLKDFVLVGPSMSGGFALKYACRYPTDLEAVVAMAPAWIEDDIEQFSKISIPVLLMWGENDSKVDPRIGQILKQVIDNSELHVFKNLNHPFYFEDEKVFKSHLIKFLLKLQEQTK